MKRDNFIFYRSFKDAISELSTKAQLKMLWNIIDYALDGKEPSFDNGTERAIFVLVRPQLDANNRRYLNGCKGAEYGKMGGAPKGNQNARKTTPKQPQNKSKTTPNVNVNVDNNVVVVTREYFCKTYNIIDDDKTTDRLDFEMLGKAYSQSIKFLQCTECAKHMSWIVKHYSEIINGKYVDYVVDMQSKHRIDVQGVIDI